MEEFRGSGDQPFRSDKGGAGQQIGIPLVRQCCDHIVRRLETFFYWWGFYVAKRPALVIGLTVVMVCALASGILNLTEEKSHVKLWMPSRSQTAANYAFARKYFPTSLRHSQAIVKADNVLEPGVLQGMHKLNQQLTAHDPNSSANWDTVCARTGPLCWSNSLLEIWAFNGAVIANLTKDDIIHAVNTVHVSPVFHNSYDAIKLLANISRDANGTVVGAGLAQLTYAVRVDESSADSEQLLDRALNWEKHFLETLSAKHDGIPEVFYYTDRTYDDEAKGATYSDLYLLSVGYAVMVVFISMVLGRFNCVEHRVYLGLAGIASVGMALGVALGIGSYSGVFYGPIHNVLAFLLLGLGVDDMFVIVQALDSLGTEVVARQHVHHQMALAMKSAGVSITITSLTDILAFSVGTTTSIPSLWAFCVYCVIGISATYILQATFFVACLTLDRQRALAGRDACCLCVKHENFKPNSCSRGEWVQQIFQRIYVPLMANTAAKVTVILLAVAMFAVSVYGVVHLDQMTDIAWVFNEDSYAFAYIRAVRKYYPESGSRSVVYIGEIDSYEEFGLLERLQQTLEEDRYIEKGSIDSWFHAFHIWLNTSTPLQNMTDELGNFPVGESSMYSAVNTFLAGEGRRFFQDIRFENNSRIIASRFSLKHTHMLDSHEEILALEHIQRITANSGLGPMKCVPYGGVPYITIEMNKVIQDELYRNIGLALVCVAVMTFPLIADFRTSFLVFINIVLILVDVAGLVHFVGLTIDVVTSLILILAIGMSVDYAAHVGHTFMTMVGTRNDRASKTLVRIGPAVFYGGASSLIALLPLSLAKAYTMKTFFQVFSAIVFFGLFHGLAFLPVVLSCIGSEPYTSALLENTTAENASLNSSNGHQEARANVSGHVPSNRDRLPNFDSATNHLEVSPTHPKDQAADEFSVSTYQERR